MFTPECRVAKCNLWVSAQQKLKPGGYVTAGLRMGDASLNLAACTRAFHF